MGKVCILNWTEAFHAGSAAVCASLGRLLAGHEIVERTRPGQHASETFSGADVVLANGEGTIHHGRPLGQILIEDLKRARWHGDIPAGIVNATWQENPDDWADVARACALVTVREPWSQRELKRQGVPGVSVFADLSLLSVRRPRALGPHAGKVVLGEGGAAGHSSLWRQLEARYGEHCVTLRGERGRPPHPPLQDVVDELAGASAYLTGEYHGLHAAAAADVPAIAYQSNSWKIESAIADYESHGEGIRLADWVWTRPRMSPADLEPLLCAR